MSRELRSGTGDQDSGLGGRSVRLDLLQRWHRWGVLLCLIVLIVLRAPALLIEPRLWAEEASIFLRHAYTHGFFESLLFAPPQLGYVLLVVNVPTAIAAHFFPIEHAAGVTTYFSAGVLIALFALILWGRSTVWDTSAKKALACLIVLFAPSSTGQVWLNALNAQVYCGLIAACLLLEDLDGLSATRRWTYRLMLGFCGLSGVYATFLSGMFLIRARLQPRREAWVHVAVAAAAALCQMAAFLRFYLFYLSSAPEERRLVTSSLAEALQNLFQHQLLFPLLGRPWGFRLSGALGALLPTSWTAVWANADWLAGLVALAYLFALLYALAPRARQHSQVLLLGCYAATAAGTAVFALGGVPGGRYAVASGVYVSWMLLNNLRLPHPDLRTAFGAALLAFMLFIGVRGYRTNGAQQFFVCRGCATWADQVKRCGPTPGCVLTVWPYPRWTFSWRDGRVFLGLTPREPQ